ncbi:hypothetical protein DERP_013767 [Dermatophagoides pteronyssinus]|uniref:Uncharacterized protein n=1 Tax=Dermatophagoides pteronyssinus TaxID=6956 RepID=A0ABQ8JFW5_DERPT|nr:hypothetical protein DERP_013767 [Dermatophagoides pteronyssinus]
MKKILNIIQLIIHYFTTWGDDADEAIGDDDSYFDEDCPYFEVEANGDDEDSYFALLSAAGDDVVFLSFGGFCTCSVSIFSITGVSTIDISTGFSLFILIIVDCCCADDGIKVLCSGGRVGGPISLVVNLGFSGVEKIFENHFLTVPCLSIESAVVVGISLE